MNNTAIVNIEMQVPRDNNWPERDEAVAERLCFNVAANVIWMYNGGNFISSTYLPVTSSRGSGLMNLTKPFVIRRASYYNLYVSNSRSPDGVEA